MKTTGLLLKLLLAISLLPLSASALLTRENGPEPVILQIKESARKSDTLDGELALLAEAQHRHHLRVERRWAGRKYLELLAFPEGHTRDRAQAVIVELRSFPFIEKVIPVSASALEFKAEGVRRFRYCS